MLIFEHDEVAAPSTSKEGTMVDQTPPLHGNGDNTHLRRRHLDDDGCDCPM
jgi:hypothetical protein